MKNLKQIINLKATPKEIYSILMSSKKHSEVIGDKAVISTKVNGNFSVFSGFAKGKNLKLVKDKQITQTWRASDWPKGTISEITFLLTKTKTGTKLTFTQKNIPDEFYKDIKKGWIDYYWTPLKQYLLN